MYDPLGVATCLQILHRTLGATRVLHLSASMDQAERLNGAVCLPPLSSLLRCFGRRADGPHCRRQISSSLREQALVGDLVTPAVLSLSTTCPLSLESTMVGSLLALFWDSPWTPRSRTTMLRKSFQATKTVRPLLPLKSEGCLLSSITHTPKRLDQTPCIQHRCDESPYAAKSLQHLCLSSQHHSNTMQIVPPFFTITFRNLPFCALYSVLGLAARRPSAL